VTVIFFSSGFELLVKVDTNVKRLFREKQVNLAEWNC
jgi:hypothetical protein